VLQRIQAPGQGQVHMPPTGATWASETSMAVPPGRVGWSVLVSLGPPTKAARVEPEPCRPDLLPAGARLLPHNPDALLEFLRLIHQQSG
jgi:hypothetical protein